MSLSTSAAPEQAARDEELRGECAKAFAHYKQGNRTRGTQLLQKLLARHPAHPLLHYAYMRLAHMQLLMAQGSMAGIQKQFEECTDRARAALNACPHYLLPCLLYFQLCHDVRIPNAQVDDMLHALRGYPTTAAKKPVNVADLEYAKAIATFDKEVFTLALLPDVRECADPAAYRNKALACLSKAPAMIVDLHRQAEYLAKNTPGRSGKEHFIVLPTPDTLRRRRGGSCAWKPTRRLRRFAG